jgi:hypothetical protein
MNRRLIYLSLVAGFLLSEQSAMAGGNTIFGLEFGKPISLPECIYKERQNGSKDYETSYTQPKTCVEDPLQLNDGAYPVPVRRITFSNSECPSYASEYCYAYAIEDENGNLVSVEVMTDGVSGMDQAFQKLTAKYGKPRVMKTSVAKNVLGASFKVIDAKWTNKYVSVWLKGTTSRLDNGEIIIDSPAGLALKKSWASKAEKEREM